MTKRPLLVAAVAVAAVTLSACGDDGDETTSTSADGLTVEASFYPVQFVTERVAGDHATVGNLTRAGGEPHDLELSPRQVGDIADADLVVYLAGFQVAVDDAVEQNATDHALDVSETVTLMEGHDEHADEGTEHDGGEDEHEDLPFDTHIWLDPTNVVTITEAVADRLAELDEDNADDYHANADALVEDLNALDTEYQDGLARCERKVIVVSHEAYGYLAKRYGLEQVGISGLDPEAEPSPQRLAEVQDVVRDEGVTTIFYERLVSPDVAETLANDLGLEAGVLDPIEGLSDETGDETYLTLMEQNLEALRTANGCS